MKIIILFSGGVDSLLCYLLAKYSGYDPILLHFIYDHPARLQEYAAVKNLAPDAYKICQEIHVEAKQMKAPTGEIGPRVVPGRNQIFISHALNAADLFGAKEIWFGACREDQRDYADCTPEFIESMNALSYMWGVKVKAPLIDFNKKAILTLLKNLLDFEEYKIDQTWSCYTPKEHQPCGSCDSCLSNSLSDV